ncbi:MULTISPECIES: hypothetical protein [Aerosakkonema]|uniref:hypothetical protein n=1 Tax=Aerosakkonema TaxID=1246629 RepID=UPI0035B879B0
MNDRALYLSRSAAIGPELLPQPALAKVLLDQPQLLKQVWEAIDRLMYGTRSHF